MSAPTPDMARLVVPAAEFDAAYVKGQQAGKATPLPAAILQILTQSVIRGRLNFSAEPRLFYQQFWIAAGDAIVGHVSLRPNTPTAAPDALGHIAYAIFPAFRGQGFGHRALAHGLAELFAQGIDDVLVCWEDDNRASIRIIEAAGGRLEQIGPHRDGGRIRRYWIGKD